MWLTPVTKRLSYSNSLLRDHVLDYGDSRCFCLPAATIRCNINNYTCRKMGFIDGYERAGHDRNAHCFRYPDGCGVYAALRFWFRQQRLLTPPLTRQASWSMVVVTLSRGLR